ncbi:TlpA family protein disulfide reductase [Xanthovirga aplysinae]|uniref:TlpA family protein disulfide reductase n=1 Tax=Xanthovirga aplysinae TaxID=2529853 RepID=UPI0012BC7077|nr:TlpA disulfide reductase family protein [Xanthovirga aplysinae]MTI30232.1 TlpA family protein disulfide reductase [Xanthovirga aplysinae]
MSFLKRFKNHFGNKLLIIAGLLIFSSFLVTAQYVNASSQPKQVPIPEPSSEQEFPDADFSMQLKDMSGKQISLEDLKGKVIFMNLWASWCSPCIKEMPSIQALYDKTDRDKVAFVMLSLDENDEKAEKFIKKRGFTFPVYRLTKNELPGLYQTQAIPTTYVISPKGKLLVRHQGMADYSSQDMVDFINEAYQQ